MSLLLEDLEVAEDGIQVSLDRLLLHDSLLPHHSVCLKLFLDLIVEVKLVFFILGLLNVLLFLIILETTELLEQVVIVARSCFKLELLHGLLSLGHCFLLHFLEEISQLLVCEDLVVVSVGSLLVFHLELCVVLAEVFFDVSTESLGLPQLLLVEGGVPFALLDYQVLLFGCEHSLLRILNGSLLLFFFPLGLSFLVELDSFSEFLFVLHYVSKELASLLLRVKLDPVRVGLLLLDLLRLLLPVRLGLVGVLGASGVRETIKNVLQIQSLYFIVHVEGQLGILVEHFEQLQVVFDQKGEVNLLFFLVEAKQLV